MDKAEQQAAQVMDKYAWSEDGMIVDTTKPWNNPDEEPSMADEQLYEEIDEPVDLLNDQDFEIAALRARVAELEGEAERLTKPDLHTCITCVHWGTSMAAYPCLECGQHYDRSDLWEPAEGGSDA